MFPACESYLILFLSVFSDDKTYQDAPIMPTTSLQQSTQKSSSNHYENHSSLVLTERNQVKNYSTTGSRSEQKQSDYSRIEYLKYKHEVSKSSYNYYNNVHHDIDHKYENLPRTTSVSTWDNDTSDQFNDIEESKKLKKANEKYAKDAAVSIKNLENLVESTRECSFQFGYPDSEWCGGQDGPEPPVRDPSSLKSIKYGPGHEKYPSWPGSVRTEGGDKPQRSHSWTDQTSYPKEKVTTYARPYNKRANPAFTQQVRFTLESEIFLIFRELQSPPVLVRN